jgi:outer membrane receptor protein involved in Fe transport
MQHTDYRQVLRKYTAGDRNPVLSNYNNALDIKQGEGINTQVGKYILSNFFNSQSLLSMGNFIAPNGFISPVYNNSWGFHTNVGWVYNTAGRSTNDVYSFSARTNFDWIPGSSKNGRHNIQVGFIYEERLNRSYSVIPRGLWDIARQQANNHIQGIAPNADTIGYIDLPNFPKTPVRALSIVNSEDNKFYKSIREELGLPLTTFVNVDGLDPDQLRLDMFSAKELNDQGAISYFGHDYLGRPFDGTFEDFFKTVDANGVRTFPVAPNRPIYSAAYIQDKFTFRDIIFRLGVRMDRYDANTRVLKDPYSLYDIMEASEFHTLPETKSEKPGSIGDNYKVYLNDSGTDVLAYRDGDQWYRSNGNPVNSPIDIFSGGLVFPKYKDPRAQSINNYIKDREFDPSVSFKDYEVQVNFMPRLAFSFPISDDANFFAHYDVLIQRPPSNTLATALDYFYFTDFPSVIRNNPDLRPERTIDYEVGFQQKLSATSKLKIAAYYKELRDMIQQRTYFPVPIVNQYTTYGNLDFGTVKGFSFEYELRRTGNLSLVTNYTLQFADGTGSDANSQRGLTSRGNLRTLFPLNFDERHRVNMNLDYRYGGGKFYNGPNLFGADILANTGLSLQAIAVSGRPYTATITPLELGGAQTAGSINGSRKPWNYTLNLRVDKIVQVSKGLNLNIYCRVSNLLNQQNILNVYSSTGSPKDDGFLASSNGQDKLTNIVNSNRLVDAYLASYQWALLNPGLFSLPRRIFAGVIMDF